MLAMTDAKGRFLGLPCRFPAKPSIFAERFAQVYDNTRVFGSEETQKNFLP
jgi:hypothetical protein